MAGLDPAIHGFATYWISAGKAWFTGSRPVVTTFNRDNQQCHSLFL
jgi:hypothetical protein